VEDGAIEEGDVIIGDVDLEVNGENVFSDENVELPMDETLQIGPLRHPTIWQHFTGLETGNTETIEIDLPDDEQLQPEDFRGATIEVELVLHEIKRPELPELDEAFADRYDCESVEELRDDIRQQIEDYKENQGEEELEQEILDQLIEQADFELPERLLEQGHEHFMRQQKSRMEQAGVPESVIRERLHEHQDDSRESIKQSMKRNYVVDAVAEREKIYVTESEVDEYIEQMASEQDQWPHELKEQLEENDQMDQVRSELKEQKVMDFLIDNVSIQEEEEDE
jgi:trigger factor